MVGRNSSNGGIIMDIITRQEAKEQGLPFYFTGKNCKHGHVASRRTSTGYCEECCDIKYKTNRQDKEYLRKEYERGKRWKLENRDMINAKRRVRDKEWYVPPQLGPRQVAKEAGDTVYFTGKPCANGHVDYRRVSCGSCVVCKSEYHKTDERRAIGREKAREYRNKFPDAERAKAKRWRQKNKPSLAAKTQRRRCAQINATPAWADHDKILTKYCERDAMSRITGLKHDVDHRIPLQGKNVCGLHIAENLRVILTKDNQSKSNKWDCG